MFKLIATYKRLPEQTPEQFREYRRGPHRQLAYQLPKLRRWVQANVLPELYAKGEPPIDGMAELYFDQEADFHAAFGTEIGKLTSADGRKYQNPATLRRGFVEEIIKRPGPIAQDGIKVLVWAAPKAGMELEAFHRYWREVHAELALKSPELVRYALNPIRPGTYAGPAPALEGWAELWFDSMASFKAAQKRPEWKLALEDAANFMDLNPASHGAAILRDEICLE